MSDLSSAGTPSPTAKPVDDTVERLREEANERARSFERENHDPRATIGDQARAAAEYAGQEGSRFAQDMKHRALGFAEGRKNDGAEQLNNVASAIERTADDLESASPQTAGYVRDAAGGMRRLSSVLRDRPVEELVSNVGDFARRQPALVFGGAVLAGLAITRLLKASAPSDRSPRPKSDPPGGSRHDIDR